MTDKSIHARTWRTGLTSGLTGLLFLSASVIPGNAADYSYKSDRLKGAYVGVLGNYTYANAEFIWDSTRIIDRDSHNWGVGGVAGYGWRWGSAYFGPEVYVEYADISTTFTGNIADVTSLSLDREIGAGVNLLAGFTGFDDAVLFYGLLGGGATNFSGDISVDGLGSLSGDIWYPVLSLGAGMDWSVSDSVAVRLQVKHTFFFDVSDRIFPENTSQSYDLDTTAVSVGLVWRPW